jgi:hypothetical protein
VNPFDREALVTSIASHVYGAETSDNRIDYKQLDEVKESVNGYSDSMLSRLTNGMHDESSELNRVEPLVYDGAAEPRVNESLYFLGMLQDVYHPQVINAVQGLRITGSLPPCEDYSSADEGTLKQCVALVSVTVAIMDCEYELKDRTLLVHRSMGIYYATALRDEELVRLVMDNADRHDVIVRAIYERKTASTTVISEVLKSSAPSLSEGAL